MRKSLLTGLVLSHLALGTQGFGEEAPVAPQPTLDAIFELPFVHSLEFAPGGKDLFVSVTDRMLQYRLDPLTLVGIETSNIIANDMAFGPDKRLYSVGWEAIPGGFGSGGSKAVVFEPGINGYSFAEDVLNTSFSQFSTIAFDGQNKPFVAGAGTFKANPLALRSQITADGTVLPPPFAFSCGGVSQLSVFEMNGKDQFVASTTGRAVLEFGTFAPSAEKGPPQSECFSVARASKGEVRKSVQDALRHVVIDVAGSDKGGRGIIVLDPNSNTLNLFRLAPYDGRLFLASAVDAQVALPSIGEGVAYTELAADAGGREIWVSSPGTNLVQRYSLGETGLQARGAFDMRQPVQRIEMAADGSAAAIVTGAKKFGGDWRLTLVGNPAAYGDRAQLPRTVPSLKLLQQTLNKAGLSAGPEDGIPGALTRTAVTAFFEVPRPKEDNAWQEIQSAIEASFPSIALEQTADTLK